MDTKDKAEPKSTKSDTSVQNAEAGLTVVERKVGWRRLFLKALAKHGKPTFAAKEAGVSVPRVYQVKAKSPRFAQAWANAVKLAQRVRIDRIEAEIERRGVDGWDEPVYQNGEVVGHKRRFDSRLLLANAEADRRKKWGKRQESAHTVNVLVTHETQARLLDDPAIAALACDLAARMAAPKALGATEIEV